MKTIIVANQKGGVGKTTVARHLAFFGAEQGRRVLAVDLDVQGNFCTTFKNLELENGFLAKREGGKTKCLTSSGLFDPKNKNKPAQCAENLFYVDADGDIVHTAQDLEQSIRIAQQRFADLSKDYDVCVVDTGPNVSALLVVALAVGDFAVAPCKPDRDAIAGLAGFFSNVVRLRDETKLNPKLSPLGVLPNQVNKNRAYHRSVLNDMRGAWGNNVLPVELYERAAIDVAKDRAVWRTETGESRSAAAKEMKAVCQHIYKRMGL